MDLDAGDYIALTAVIFTALAVWYSRSQTRAATRQADAAEAQTDASLRQAAAAEAQADASLRQAVAAEAQVEVMQKQLVSIEEQVHITPPPVAPWVLRHVRGDTYLLVNGGRTTAHEVKIALPENVVFRGELEHEQIEPGSGVTLMLTRTWGSGDVVTVTWSPRQGAPDRLTWTGAIPAKPAGAS